MTLERARAACLAATGLPAPRKTSIVSVLECSGPVRTLGGVEAYLALRARVPGATRANVDRVVEKHEAQVVPFVRGCMYLVPRRDVPLALRTAGLLSRARAEREQQKAGIKPGEVDKLAKQVLAALRKSGAMTTDSLRKALPEGAVRSLGPAGKKVGVSSPLPSTLRQLEFDGQIERTSAGGRLDTERYLWRAAEKSPFVGARLPEEPADLWARLAGVFFRAAGLGTLEDFSEWAGISRREAKAAAERLALVPVAIEDSKKIWLAVEESHEALLAAADVEQAVALLPFTDNLVALHGGPALFVAPEHHGLSVPSWGGVGKTKLAEARHLSFRCVVAEGKIIGFWEYDPDSREVVLSCFDRVRPATRKRLGEVVSDLSAFLSQDLGHARSFSLDTDDDLRERVAALRKL